MKTYVGVQGIKDGTGAFVKCVPGKVEPPPVKIPEPSSLDEIGEVIILNLARAVKFLGEKILEGDVSREVVGALKDCEGMHRELNKREKEWMAALSDEDLETLANTPMKLDDSAEKIV